MVIAGQLARRHGAADRGGELLWAQTGPRAYRLNHYALAWNQVDGHTFVGPANIRESILLAPNHNTYGGNFTLVQYAPDGKTMLAHVQGVVTARRVAVGK